jgi:hypothetical protein
VTEGACWVLTLAYPNLLETDMLGGCCCCLLRSLFFLSIFQIAHNIREMVNLLLDGSRLNEDKQQDLNTRIVIESPNYDGPHVPVIVIITSDRRTYVSHNLKGMLSSEQDLITGVLQYYNSLFKIPSE